MKKTYKLTDKLSALAPYAVLEGEYNIRLDANESFLNVNETLSVKLSEEISKICLNRYPDPYAVKAVEAFSALYNIPCEFVLAGNGSDELISIISSCFLAKGDRILTLAPDFSMYAFYGSLYELENIVLPKNDDLTIDADRVINYCNTENIKALIFSNPCNPTSLGLKKSEILRILSAVSCLVVIDEAYMDFWDESVLDCVGEFDNLIVLKTCSKALGLAAVRMGFAVAGNTLTNVLRAVKSPYNTDTISQTVTACVLSEKQLLLTETAKIIASRESLYEGIKRLDAYKWIEMVYKTVTNFVFIKTEKADEVFSALLKKSIVVRNMNGFLRITAGNSAENARLLEELETILRELK